MKVIFCIPALDGAIKTRCHQSLISAYHILSARGIEHDEFIIENCSCLPDARNNLVAMFMADQDATDLFFIDSDVGFDASGVLKILERAEEIVGGIYPLKRQVAGYPVAIKTADGIPLGRDGLIAADYLPTGFLRIKRSAIDRLMLAYPNRKYTCSVAEISNANVTAAYNFFDYGFSPSGRRILEDFFFSQLWRDIGGELWVCPDIDFGHIGSWTYSGNYHQFLLSCPGGRNSSKVGIHRAVQIDGWMTRPELEWLSTQAELHTNIVEIGSWLGRSTRALADNTNGHVLAVDTWKGSEEHQPALADIPDMLFAAFQNNTSGLSNLTAIRKTSMEAAASEQEKFDMVFIDAAHDYENVRDDITAWKGKLTPGGLLCGHDYDRDGVKSAVSELLPHAAVVPNTNIWYTEV